MYYYIRNRFHIHKAKFSNKALAFISYGCFLMAFAGITLLYQKTNKLKKLSFIMWPVADAFNNNFNATPPLILEKLKIRSKIILITDLYIILKIFGHYYLHHYHWRRKCRPRKYYNPSKTTLCLLSIKQAFFFYIVCILNKKNCNYIKRHTGNFIPYQSAKIWCGGTNK